VFSTTLALPRWLNRGLEGFPVKALVDLFRTGYAPALVISAIGYCVGVGPIYN
jgi:hypothetical protein